MKVNEIWKDIKDFSKYQVSNLGRIKSKGSVRTKNGYICKIVNINDFREPSMKYGVEASYLKDIMFIGDDLISKHSLNIIDLIEVGDYVNGKQVIDFMLENGKRKGIIVDADIWGFDIDEIKSIVTHEQFESMEYKL